MRATRLALLVTGVLCADTAHGSAPGFEHWQDGIELYKAERYAQAQESFARASRDDPANSDYSLWLGLAMGRRAERMTGLRRLGAFSLARKVRQAFERAVELDPANLAALEALLNFHLEAPGIVGGSKQTAREVAGRIETLDAARGARAWAALLEKAGEIEAAAMRHARARELNPGHVGHLLAQASFWSRRGEAERSDALFQQAAELAPGDPEVWLATAKAWLRAGRESKREQARALLERYLASPDRKPDAEPASAVRKLLASR